MKHKCETRLNWCAKHPRWSVVLLGWRAEPGFKGKWCVFAPYFLFYAKEFDDRIEALNYANQQARKEQNASI